MSEYVLYTLVTSLNMMKCNISVQSWGSTNQDIQHFVAKVWQPQSCCCKEMSKLEAPNSEYIAYIQDVELM